ncbi:Crp/Fnr family transcriptional regulator [Streptomyces sp. NPDC006365]|uniref:Crp/Fnr family transcriptional regulator n=1 Tax=Streptomyces sp. NPDC006365 TaxID=3364744 RepID=UPI0036B19B39
MSVTATMTSAHSAPHRERLIRIAREVTFLAGTRIFEEGGRADRFWIIRTGTVTLDMHTPGRRSAVIENLGHNELLGCSWLSPPNAWRMGAEAITPVRAYEVDAETVRMMCHSDPALGVAVAGWVARALADRLQAARARLLDLYTPCGSGGLG